jgi:hypothetical protein
VVSAIRNLARWLVWQVSVHEDASSDQVPANITVFSTGDRQLPGV